MNTLFVRCASVVHLLFLFLLATLRPCAAQWDGPGITHVPICGTAAYPLGPGEWFGIPAALDEALLPEDLAKLRGQPGFTGLTDAQIQAKVVKIRKEVFEAIQLIYTYDYALGQRLETEFLNRRIVFEFSDRQIAGAVNGKALGSPEKAAEVNGIIALKAYPGDTVPDYDKQFIRLLAALTHEGTHLAQKWPPPTREITFIDFRNWKEEMDSRVRWQDNEIAASRRERALTYSFWYAMRGIRLQGKVPDDNPAQNIVIPPMVRAIAGKFLQETPPAERAAKAGAIENSMLEVFGTADQIIEGRLAIRNKAAEMRDRQPQPGSNAQLVAFQFEWLEFVRGSSLYAQMGDKILSGIFSVTLLAGGGGANANTVRQYNDSGVILPVTIPGLSAITDVAFLNNRTILIGGKSTTAGNGAVYSLTDTTMDNFFDASSLTLVQSMSGLADGVSLACDPTTGRGFCLGRKTGNLYRLTPAPPAIPTSLTFVSSINSGPVLDENFQLLLPAGSPELFFVPEIGGMITEATQWSAVPSTGSITNNIRQFRPITDCEFQPIFLDLPFIGDRHLRCGTVPNAEVKLYDASVEPPVLLDTTTADENGDAMFYRSFVGDTAIRFYSMQRFGDAVRPPPPVTDANHQIALPSAVYIPGLAGPMVNPPVFQVPPHTEYQMDFSERATWSTSNTTIATVNGGALTAVAAAPFSTTNGWPNTGFWRIKWLERKDIVPDGRVFTVPPGITATIQLNIGECDFDSADRRSTATYTILDRGGLHEKACHLSANGRALECTPLLTHDPSTSPNIIKVRRTDVISSETQDFFISVYSNRRALVPTDVGPNSTVDVPCLIIGGVPYPIYQFFLMNTETDLCTEPHWHSGGIAYSLYTPTVPTNEPPGSCGWGLLEAVEFDYVLTNTADWLNFVAAHPPPVSIYN